MTQIDNYKAELAKEKETEIENYRKLTETEQTNKTIVFSDRSKIEIYEGM